MDTDEPARLPAADGEAIPLQSLADLQQALLEDLYNDQLLNDCYQQLLAGDVAPGMQALIEGLCERRSDSSDREWEQFVQLCRRHPLLQVLHQDPFTRHVFQKCQDHAIDAKALDFMYDIHEVPGPPDGTSELGCKIFACTTGLPICEGFRIRRQRVAETVHRLSLETSRPQILAVASGHLREVHLAQTLQLGSLGRWVALDSDTDSLQEIQRCHGVHGIQTMAGTVAQLLERRLDLGHFDLIYSTGLYDQLEQLTGVRLTECLFDMLRPGGQLLISNFLPEIKGRGYLECFMNWRLIYRDQERLHNLAATIATRAKDLTLTEDLPHLMFLRVTKE